jgi:hypothetical protein
VQEETGVENIVVDSDINPAVVRIKGRSADSVSQARARLEYAVESIPLTPRELGWIIGEGGAKMNEIRFKSGAMKIEHDSNEGNTGSAAAASSSRGRGHQTSSAVVRVTGLRAAVDTAIMMVQAELMYLPQILETERNIEDARKQLKSLDIAYGSAPRRRAPGGPGGRRDDDDEDEEPRRDNDYRRGGQGARGGGAGGRGGYQGQGGRPASSQQQQQRGGQRS